MWEMIDPNLPFGLIPRWNHGPGFRLIPRWIRLSTDNAPRTWQNCFTSTGSSKHENCMSMKWSADDLVSARSENINRYKRNLLKQAVCELRFPTLMELGDARPPAALVSALRKDYPHLEMANEVTFGIGGGVPGGNNAHIFRSSKLNWTVSLKQSALSIETTAYSEYDQLKERVLKVVAAAAKVIDSDFFTRIGLRYINAIDAQDTDPIDGWINPELVQPLLSHKFTGIHDYAGRLQLISDDGGCLLQHGIRPKQSHRDGKTRFPEYLFDIDSFRNDVALSDTEAALDVMHMQAFDVFDWCLGSKAREYLSSKGK